MLVYATLIVNLCLVNAHIVRTKYGLVSGTKAVSRGNVEYLAFRGIPFAEPPLGELRFEDPQEPRQWEGVKMAEEYSQPCPQPGWSSSTVSGDEDCLYINVFTPTVNSSAKLPVMVWIYGGGFVIGDGAIYGPDYIMDKNLILVTFNYRVGALGFLSMGSADLRGNYGMKDQVLALKWVKNNIKAFGGDPEQVTITGESVGGASVHWHMYSPSSKGSFQRAISQSGTARSIWSEVPLRVAKRRAITFASLAGCFQETVADLVKCLKAVPVSEIMKTQYKFKIWVRSTLIWGIVVSPADWFVTKSPWNDDNPVNEVPWIVGHTSDEGASIITGLLIHKGAELVDINEDRRRLIPIVFSLDNLQNVKTYDHMTLLTEILIERYFGDRDISVETVANVKNMVADTFMLYDMTESLLKFKKEKYFYVYDHVGEQSFTDFEDDIIEDGLGAVHCDDLISLFKLTDFSRELTGADREVSEFMVNLWTNFVIYGDPNGVKYSENKIWQPVQSDELALLHIGTKPRMENWSWKDRYSFWNSLNLRRTDDEGGLYYFNCLFEITGKYLNTLDNFKRLYNMRSEV